MDDEVAFAPFVTVDCFRSCREGLDLLEQGVALFRRHPIHMQRVIGAQIEGFPLDIGMYPNQGVR